MSAYISSEWFQTCVDIGAEFDKLRIVQLEEALGIIDEFISVKSLYNSWSGLKDFFSQKLEMLTVISTLERMADLRKYFRVHSQNFGVHGVQRPKMCTRGAQ